MWMVREVVVVALLLTDKLFRLIGAVLVNGLLAIEKNDIVVKSVIGRARKLGARNDPMAVLFRKKVVSCSAVVSTWILMKTYIRDIERGLY